MQPYIHVPRDSSNGGGTQNSGNTTITHFNTSSLASGPLLSEHSGKGNIMSRVYSKMRESSVRFKPGGRTAGKPPLLRSSKLCSFQASPFSEGCRNTLNAQPRDTQTWSCACFIRCRG